jgi:hypothetical protein
MQPAPIVMSTAAEVNFGPNILVVWFQRTIRDGAQPRHVQQVISVGRPA